MVNFMRNCYKIYPVVFCMFCLPAPGEAYEDDEEIDIEDRMEFKAEIPTVSLNFLTKMNKNYQTENQKLKNEVAALKARLTLAIKNVRALSDALIDPSLTKEQKELISVNGHTLANLLHHD